ncbi:hypothetical protein [Solirubrobacter soli]|uniref:hypothetical protein n=1 Tax=Solirubrobacter soli TaxID=363832 RepID=UPI0003FB8646|nr:hypothetical protein [Solirubrobacter soli]
MAIEESTGFTSLDPAAWRGDDPIGGRLDVIHDDLGVRLVRRADSGLDVWERLDRPWPDALTGFAEALAQASIDGVAEDCRKAGVKASDEFFALAVVPYPVAVTELCPLLFLGRERDRRRLIDDPDEDLEEYLWWLQHSRADGVVGGAHPPEDVQRAAVRACTMHHLADPLETLCQAAVPILAEYDWSELFTPTPDFAVYVIGEDVNETDIYRSLLAGNPAHRLAERAARWRGSPYPPEDH